MSDTSETNDQTKPPTPPAPKEKPKRVRVLCQDTLGYLGLTKGDVTEDAGYVALLKTKRGRSLVEEVK